MRLMTLYRANFGTALENFSLAVFRGKLGEFPMWLQLYCITAMIKYIRHASARTMERIFIWISIHF